MTRSATLGRDFFLDEAFSGTIDMPYVPCMLLLHISMLIFTFILRMAAAMSLSVRRPRPALTGFRHEYAGSGPDCLNYTLCLVNQDSVTDFYVLPRFTGSAADRHHSSTAIIVVHHFAV
jgi:hypothetical protein